MPIKEGVPIVSPAECLRQLRAYNEAVTGLVSYSRAILPKINGTFRSELKANLDAVEKFFATKKE